MLPESALENYFYPFRRNIIGNHQTFESPFGTKEIVYADWTATGRAYQPIEDYLQAQILPLLANTHTHATVTGTIMSDAYEEAKQMIKKHVGAGCEDIIIFCGSGMTAAVNKLQRILGLRIPERLTDYMKKDAPGIEIDEELKPVVFVTHMEHHSNHLSWLETIASVEIIKPDNKGNVDLKHFKSLLEKYKNRENKIAAVTACSNVTGIQTPYYEIAKLVHGYGGLCFVDFACSAPYININMHSKKHVENLDAIYFSPHKFLGGTGTPGVLIINKKLYKNNIPDQPGGGTVLYTNPWKFHEFVTNIEDREDGGTPPFIGALKTAMCIRLKEAMGVENIRRRKEELLEMMLKRFATIKNIEIFKGNPAERSGIVSFIVKGLHHNLVVKILNDRFGIQTRGGCSCAGIYGHLLLKVNRAKSYKILKEIRSGNLSAKPGWIRLSVHPTMTNEEIEFIMDAIELTAANYKEWMMDYVYEASSNEYSFKGYKLKQPKQVEDWSRFLMGMHQPQNTDSMNYPNLL